MRNLLPLLAVSAPMSILKVTHRTTYRYRAPVEFGEHRWMFRPRDSQLQRLTSEGPCFPYPARSLEPRVVITQMAASRSTPARELTFESAITARTHPQAARTPH